MATHSCIFAWRVPWTGEPGGLLSIGSLRVGHDWSDLAAAAGKEKKKKRTKACGLQLSNLLVWEKQSVTDAKEEVDVMTNVD